MKTVMKTLQQHNMAMQPPTMDKPASFRIGRENKFHSMVGKFVYLRQPTPISIQYVTVGNLCFTNASKHVVFLSKVT